MSDLEQDLPGTIVCYADMCRFMAQEDVIKERDKRIKELEASISKMYDAELIGWYWMDELGLSSKEDT